MHEKYLKEYIIKLATLSHYDKQTYFYKKNL